MKNFKIISAAILVVSCLNTNTSTASTSNDLMAKLKARMESRQGGGSPSQGLSSTDMNKLKAKMKSMSGGSGSNDFMAKLKAKMAKQGSGGVTTQSIDSQEIVAPVSESIPSAFAAPTEQIVSLSDVAPAVNFDDTETTPVPTNLALEPAVDPTTTEEIVTLPVQGISEDAPIIASPEDLFAPEDEELEPSLVSTIGMATPLIGQSEEEDLSAPVAIEEDALADQEDESGLDTQPIVTPTNQLVAEDGLIDQEDNENESITDPIAVDSANIPMVEDTDIEEQEAPFASAIAAEPVETPLLETSMENESIDVSVQDQPEEILVPTVPTEPVEVPMIAQDESSVSDLATGTINDDKVVIVKVYPVLDALYSAAQSVKVAAFDMINYVLNKAKTARKKVAKPLAAPEVNSEDAE